MRSFSVVTAFSVAFLALSPVRAADDISWPGRAPVAALAGFSQSGLAGPPFCNGSVAGTTAAIGPTVLVQAIDCRAAIYDRVTGGLIASGSLDLLANGQARQPQMIWDATTRRFYYAMLGRTASGDRILYGFSKTATPVNLVDAWCHYSISGAMVMDTPRLGDSATFVIIGYSSAGLSGPVGSIVALIKPPRGTACPAVSSFKIARKTNLRGLSGHYVQNPTPANQIDPSQTGYVATLDLTGRDNITIFTILPNSVTGAPVFTATRTLAIPAFAPPPAAAQPGGKPLQSNEYFSSAMQAYDPRLGKFALWTAHTVADPSGALSRVRWYEIDPVAASPTLLRSGEISEAGAFVFNAAISSDRRVDGSTRLFGDSFVLNATVSGTAIAPRIAAYSSLRGGPVSTLIIRNGVGPYQDVRCSPTTCYWGGAAAAPDPKPVALGSGVVWGSNQYSGVRNPSPVVINWRSWNFAVAP